MIVRPKIQQLDVGCLKSDPPGLPVIFRSRMIQLSKISERKKVNFLIKAKAKAKAKVKKRKIIAYITPAIFVILIIAVVFIGFQVCMQSFSNVLNDFAKSVSVQSNSNNTLALDSNAKDWQGASGKVTTTGSITIPGFERMMLKANTTSQSAGFYNPSNNACYFVIELSLEDGTVVYKSGLIAPGKALYDISLKSTLTSGTYTGHLKYYCYSMADLHELNGADVNLLLEVK